MKRFNYKDVIEINQWDNKVHIATDSILKAYEFDTECEAKDFYKSEVTKINEVNKLTEVTE